MHEFANFLRLVVVQSIQRSKQGMPLQELIKWNRLEAWQLSEYLRARRS